MNRRLILSSLILAATVALWLAKNNLHEQVTASKATTETKSNAVYWTCPMHPQIHQEHAGECPICHMKLVPVKAEPEKTTESARAEIQPSPNQLALIGVQKTAVERMDLKVSIPVAGRLLSGSSVAFQVYESDLSFVKAGLPFTGRSGLIPNGHIKGTITVVDSIVDPTSRTVRVLGHIDNGPQNLISETTFSGAVEVPLKGRLAIPESAVLHTGTNDLVYVFTEGGRLAPRAVTLGPKTEGFYEVLSGLTADESISSGPNFLIDSEARIRGTSDQALSHGKTVE